LTDGLTAPFVGVASVLGSGLFAAAKPRNDSKAATTPGHKLPAGPKPAARSFAALSCINARSLAFCVRATAASKASAASRWQKGETEKSGIR